MNLKIDVAHGVMLDLETLGTAPGCVVLSIGACTLDLKETFYEKMAVDDCVANGLEIDMETMAWWNKQSNEARLEAFSGIKGLVEVLGAFDDWLRKVKANAIWGNGADFDQPILLAAYKAASITPSGWPRYGNRCYRTVKTMFEVPPIAFIGTKHNALEDAIHQAKQLTATMQKYGALLSV